MPRKAPRVLIVSDPPAAVGGGSPHEAATWSEFATGHLDTLDRFDCLILGGPFSVLRGAAGITSKRLPRWSITMLKPTGAKFGPPEEAASLAVAPVFVDRRVDAWAKGKGRSLVVLLPVEAERVDPTASSGPEDHGGSPEGHYEISVRTESQEVLAHFAGEGAALAAEAGEVPADAGDAWPREIWAEGLSSVAAPSVLSAKGRGEGATRWAKPILRPEGWPAKTGLCLAGQFREATFLVVPTEVWRWPARWSAYPQDPATRLTDLATVQRIVSAARRFHGFDPRELKRLAVEGTYCDCGVPACNRPAIAPWPEMEFDGTGGKWVLYVPGVGKAALTEIHSLVLRILEPAGKAGVSAEELKKQVRAGGRVHEKGRAGGKPPGPYDWVSDLREELEEHPCLRLCRNVVKTVLPHSTGSRYRYLRDPADWDAKKRAVWAP